MKYSTFVWAATAFAAGPPAIAAVPAKPQAEVNPTTASVPYTVQRGDSFYSIGVRGFRDARGAVMAQRLNRIADPRRLRPGSTLMLPYAILRIEPDKASVLTFRGNVTLMSGGGSRTATAGALIAEGDTIATGADAFVTIGLADGSRVSLPSQSRLRVAALHRVVLTDAVIRRFTLVEGQLETSVQPVGPARNRFEVSTPVSVAAVRGTVFRATFDPVAMRSGTGVVGGIVDVSGSGGRVEVTAGRGVLADPAGPGTVMPLLAAPNLADPDRRQDERTLVFNLLPVDGATRYRAKLATDAGFVDVIGDAAAQTPQLGFSDVGNGSYFVRITAISPAGLEGLPRDYAFDRQVNVISGSAQPPEQCPARRCMRFRWIAEGEGERRYRFQLRQTPDTPPLVDLAGLAVTEVVLTDLPGGTYVWRLESTATSAGRSAGKWSEYRELRIAAARR